MTFKTHVLIIFLIGIMIVLVLLGSVSIHYSFTNFVVFLLFVITYLPISIFLLINHQSEKSLKLYLSKICLYWLILLYFAVLSVFLGKEIRYQRFYNTVTETRTIIDCIEKYYDDYGHYPDGIETLTSVNKILVIPKSILKEVYYVKQGNAYLISIWRPDGFFLESEYVYDSSVQRWGPSPD